MIDPLLAVLGDQKCPLCQSRLGRLIPTREYRVLFFEFPERTLLIYVFAS